MILFFTIIFYLYSLSPSSSFLDFFIISDRIIDSFLAHEWDGTDGRFGRYPPFKYYQLKEAFPEINLDEHAKGRALVHAIIGRYLETLKNGEANKDRFLKKLRYLKKSGVYLNHSSHYGSLLEMVGASIAENEETLWLLEELLQMGADPNSKWNAFRIVSQTEAIRAHSFLREHVKRELMCPLKTCIEATNYQSARLLVQYNASIEETVDEGHSVVMYLLSDLSQKTNLDDQKKVYIENLIVDILKKKPNLIRQNLRGQTLLHILNHCQWEDEKLQSSIQTLFKEYVSDYPFESWSSRIQDNQGQAINGEVSLYKTFILEGYPLYQPFGSQFDQGLPCLWDNLKALKNAYQVLLCVYRMCPVIENSKNELRVHAFMHHVRDLLQTHFKQNKQSVHDFVSCFDTINIPYDDLILYSLSLVESEETVSSFCIDLLNYIKIYVSKGSLSPRSLFFLGLWDETNRTVCIEKLVDAIIQRNEWVYPVLLSFYSEKGVIELLMELNKRAYASSLYDIRNLLPRMIEMELYRKIGKFLGKNRHGLYQKNQEEIKIIQKNMKENIKEIKELTDILPSSFQQQEPFPFQVKVYGRSVVIETDTQQYSLKIKKKKEEDEVFLDGAVINWGIQKGHSVIKRQFEESQMVSIEAGLLEDLVSQIQLQEEFKNVEFDPVAYVIVTKHKKYYDYLFQPQKDRARSQKWENVRKREEIFLSGLKQSMYDYSSLAEANLFLNDLTSNSHGEGRSYDYANYLNMNDPWNHGAGSFENIRYGHHVSNISSEGLRDLGNLMKTKKGDMKEAYSERLNVRNNGLFEKLNEGEQDEKLLMEYSRTLSEHLFVHYTIFLTFLKENIQVFYRMTGERFQAILEENILDPFCEVHFKKSMKEEDYETFRRYVSFFFAPLVQEDWFLFKNIPNCIERVISRGGRDFPLQNVFTGFSRLISLVNLKEVGGDGWSCFLQEKGLKECLLNSEDQSNVGEKRDGFSCEKREMKKCSCFFEKILQEDRDDVDSEIAFIQDNSYLIAHYLVEQKCFFLQKLLDLKKCVLDRMSCNLKQGVLSKILRHVILISIKKDYLEVMKKALFYIQKNFMKKLVFNHTFLYPWTFSLRGKYWEYLEKYIDLNEESFSYLLGRDYPSYEDHLIKDVAFFKWIWKQFKNSERTQESRSYIWSLLDADVLKKNIHLLKEEIAEDIDFILSPRDVSLDLHCVYFQTFLEYCEENGKEVKKECLRSLSLESFYLDFCIKKIESLEREYSILLSKCLCRKKILFFRRCCVHDVHLKQLQAKIEKKKEELKYYCQESASFGAIFRVMSIYPYNSLQYIDLNCFRGVKHLDISCEVYLFFEKHYPDILETWQLDMFSYFNLFNRMENVDLVKQVLLVMKKRGIGLYDSEVRKLVAKSAMDVPSIWVCLSYFSLDEFDLESFFLGCLSLKEKKALFVNAAKKNYGSYEKLSYRIIQFLFKEFKKECGDNIYLDILNLAFEDKILTETLLKKTYDGEEISEESKWLVCCELFVFKNLTFKDCFDRQTVLGHFLFQSGVCQKYCDDIFYYFFKKECYSSGLLIDFEEKFFREVEKFLSSYKDQLFKKYCDDYIDVKDIVDKIVALMDKIEGFSLEKNVSGGISFQKALQYVFFGQLIEPMETSLQKRGFSFLTGFSQISA